jgi:hypothetical protein
MIARLFLLLSVCVAALMPPRVSAHSWYPMRCCHDRDCHPADTAHRLADGSGALAAPSSCGFHGAFRSRPVQMGDRTSACSRVAGDLRRAVCSSLPGRSGMAPSWSTRLLVDPPVGLKQQFFGNRQSESPGCLQVENQLKLRRLLDRQCGSLGAFDNPVYVVGNTPDHGVEVG